MPTYVLPILVGAGILLLVLGLVGSSSIDPVQARLTQLGSTQARNLEELDLQQPLSERTLRPLIGRLSRMGSRLSSASSADTAERRLAMAGNPGELKLTDWMGVKLLVGIVTGVICFFLLGVVVSGTPVTDPMTFAKGFMFGMVGFGIGFLMPEFWLGSKIKARQKVILKMIPDSLDLLTISVRAGAPWPKCGLARPGAMPCAT